MRMLNMWKWTTAVALVAFGLPASAETLYRWTAEDGSVSFTDEAKRIPARYRGASQTIQTGGLSGYKQYSPTKAEGQGAYAEKLATRLERLRELNSRLEAEAAARGYAGATVSPSAATEAYVRVGDDLTVKVPAGADGAAPVVVQDVRVRQPGSVFTSTDTVISQDGRVLLVVRGDRHSQNPSSDTLDERELIEAGDFLR
jgi:hypothetical protein